MENFITPRIMTKVITRRIVLYVVYVHRLVQFVSKFLENCEGFSNVYRSLAIQTIVLYPVCVLQVLSEIHIQPTIQIL